MMSPITIVDVLRFLIANGPGRTEAELAHAIFGADGYQQRVNSDCRFLAGSGQVERRGTGGPSDPYLYFPSDGSDKAAFYAKDESYGQF